MDLKQKISGLTIWCVSSVLELLKLSSYLKTFHRKVAISGASQVELQPLKSNDLNLRKFKDTEQLSELRKGLLLKLIEIHRKNSKLFKIFVNFFFQSKRFLLKRFSFVS